MSTIPDRDPTPGELRIMFSNIIDALREVKDTMATKEFVNAKFEGSSDRITRVEADLKELSRLTAEAHVELDRDSKERHAESKASFAAMEISHMSRVDLIEGQQKEDQTEIKQVRNGRMNLLIVAALSIVGNLIVLYVSTSGFK